MAPTAVVPEDLLGWLEDLKPRFKDALEEQAKVRLLLRTTLTRCLDVKVHLLLDGRCAILVCTLNPGSYGERALKRTSRGQQHHSSETRFH